GFSLTEVSGHRDNKGANLIKMRRELVSKVYGFPALRYRGFLPNPTNPSRSLGHLLRCFQYRWVSASPMIPTSVRSKPVPGRIVHPPPPPPLLMPWVLEVKLAVTVRSPVRVTVQVPAPLHP